MIASLSYIINSRSALAMKWDLVSKTKLGPRRWLSRYLLLKPDDLSLNPKNPDKSQMFMSIIPTLSRQDRRQRQVNPQVTGQLGVCTAAQKQTRKTASKK